MTQDAPDKPRIALSLALAGKRRIPPSAVHGLSETLTQVFHAVAGRLLSLSESAATGDALSLRFAADMRPRLTLITGLADGADQLAGRIFLNPDPTFPDVEKRLGAIIPCRQADFVANSPVRDAAGFATAAAACAFIVELDGALPPSPGPAGDGDGPEARRARQDRSRAFSDQSEILLRQADLLIAIDDPADDGRVGGTRQTIRAALDMGMPVILLRVGHDDIALVRSRADLEEPAALPEEHARQTLWAVVGEMVGASGLPRDIGYVRDFLIEFYGPSVPKREGLNWLWEFFEGRFRDRARVTSDEAAVAYQFYRKRASLLSAHYASLYRGTFLMGYALAVVAVLLAVGALAMFPLRQPLGLSVRGLEAVLFLFGAGKLAVVVQILNLSNRANRQRLAHRAADYRYLSERLRTMIYLPHAGALRSPYNWSLPYTTRVSTQDMIDRLFTSIVRQVSPEDVTPGPREGTALRPEASEALALIRTGWLAGQRLYHERNRDIQKRMSRWIEGTGRRLNQTVIGIVVVDLIIAGLGVTGLIEHLPTGIGEMLDNGGTPMLIALAAILPAAVASLNGVQFQSECSRLADRSEHMVNQLRQLEDKAGLARLRPVRILDALRLGEDIAQTTIDEVAEWSAIYGKDFIEI